MPFLDLEQLKKAPGERRRISFADELPSLVIDGREVNFAKLAQFELMMTYIGDAVAVEGTIMVELPMSCHRCLMEFPLSLQVDFLETYQEKSRLSYHDQDNRVSYEGDIIDLEPEVLSAIYLALPMRLVCDEECRGLCQRCGTNLNLEKCSCTSAEVDPRLTQLKNLL